MPIRLFDRASWNTRIQHELSKNMQKLNSSLRWNTKLYSILFQVITHPFKGSTWKFDISRSMNENRLSQDNEERLLKFTRQQIPVTLVNLIAELIELIAEILAHFTREKHCYKWPYHQTHWNEQFSWIWTRNSLWIQRKNNFY